MKDGMVEKLSHATVPLKNRVQRHKWGIISALITKHLGISLFRKKSILLYTLNDSTIESSDFDIFLENSICLMCFWFGLEILRLVFLKSVFWNITQFLSYLTFYPPKKVALPLIRVEKNSSKLGKQGIKRSGIWHWFQKCA